MINKISKKMIKPLATIFGVINVVVYFFSRAAKLVELSRFVENSLAI